MRQWKWQLAVTVMTGLWVGQSAWAVVGHAVNRQDNHLYEIDMNTGQTTDIGLVADVTGAPFTDVRALTFDTSDAGPNRGVLYGVDAETDELLQIDPGTGTATVIGGLNLNINEFVGMTFDKGILDESPDGSLLLSNWTIDPNTITTDPTDVRWNGALYTLDPTTGNATLLINLLTNTGDLGFLDPAFTDIASVNPLFGNPSGGLRTRDIDPDSGTVSGSTANDPSQDLFIDQDANVGLASTADGVVLGVVDFPSFNGTFVARTPGGSLRLAEINSGSFDNLAIAPGQNFIEAVPEPATAMLGLMGLSALGAVARRRVA